MAGEGGGRRGDSEEGSWDEVIFRKERRERTGCDNLTKFLRGAALSEEGFISADQGSTGRHRWMEIRG